MKLLKIRDVATLFAVQPTTISRWVKLGQFPRPVRVGRSIRWQEECLLDWLKAKIASGQSVPGKPSDPTNMTTRPSARNSSLEDNTMQK